MSDLLQKKDFLIWTKGPTALDVMKKAVCGHIEDVWLQHLKKFTDDEIGHIEQFIEDMNNGWAVADFKEKKWKLKCGHPLCKSLFDELLEIRQNKKSLKIVWKTKCTFRRGVAHQRKICELAHQRKICESFYWNIANMFMFDGGEQNEIENSSPADTDVALVLKMLKNCTLFEVDEMDIYDEVIGIRNRLFHTGQYNMTEDVMEAMIDKMIDLLKQIQELPDCKPENEHQITNGIRGLEEIKRRVVVAISVNKDTDWKPMAVRALQLQQEAITIDVNFKLSLQYDTTALKCILEDTNLRIQEYTNSAEWRQYMLQKRMKEWRRENLAGLFSEEFANGLSGLGPLGRATGAVVGGTIGTVAEGGKKLIDWIF